MNNELKAIYELLVNNFKDKDLKELIDLLRDYTANGSYEYYTYEDNNALEIQLIYNKLLKAINKQENNSDSILLIDYLITLWSINHSDKEIMEKFIKLGVQDKELLDYIKSELEV